MLMPSTSLSLTARSTVLSVSLAASAADFCSCREVVKVARGTVVIKLELAAVRVMDAMRRAVTSVRKDILGMFLCELSRWLLFQGRLQRQYRRCMQGQAGFFGVLVDGWSRKTRFAIV